MATETTAAQHNAAALIRAIKDVALSFETADTETLQLVHAGLGDHFTTVSAPGTLVNATEQRVLGLMWAEYEQELDRRRGE